jgi:hypothetical protein
MEQKTKGQKGKKGKAPDKRPARKKYWLSRALEKNKVKQIMRYSSMSYAAALEYWRTLRQKRIPAGFIKGT